jgi:hypothetical protein
MDTTEQNWQMFKIAREYGLSYKIVEPTDYSM